MGCTRPLPVGENEWSWEVNGPRALTEGAQMAVMFGQQFLGWRLKSHRGTCCCCSPPTKSLGPGAIFTLVLRNPGSCPSRKGKNRLLLTHITMEVPPFHCCYKHIRGLSVDGGCYLTRPTRSAEARKAPLPLLGLKCGQSRTVSGVTAGVPPAPLPEAVRQVG